MTYKHSSKSKSKPPDRLVLIITICWLRKTDYILTTKLSCINQTATFLCVCRFVAVHSNYVLTVLGRKTVTSNNKFIGLFFKMYFLAGQKSVVKESGRLLCFWKFSNSAFLCPVSVDSCQG